MNKKEQELIIMIGNIGTGKSLLSSKYAKMGYVIVNMDMITIMIGGGDYGLYDINKKEIYNNIEIIAVETALKNGFSVIVDRTNMDKKRRLKYIKIGKEYNVKIIARNFGVGDIQSLNRRLKNSNNISRDIWKNVYNRNQENYEYPKKEEGFDEIINQDIRYKIYAFDFDGTIVDHRYPEIGKPKEKVINIMKKIDFLNNIIIIWTCRHGDTLYEMKKFLLDNNILFDFINENPIFDTGSRKIYADVYYDDRGINPITEKDNIK